MSEHTKEPWTWGLVDDGPDCVIGAHGLLWARVRPSLHHSAEANARRIVACVNAMAGIPTEEIESGILKSVLEVATNKAAQISSLRAIRTKIAKEIQKSKEKKG